MAKDENQYTYKIYMVGKCIYSICVSCFVSFRFKLIELWRSCLQSQFSNRVCLMTLQYFPDNFYGIQNPYVSNEGN